MLLLSSDYVLRFTCRPMPGIGMACHRVSSSALVNIGAVMRDTLPLRFNIVLRAVALLRRHMANIRFIVIQHWRIPSVLRQPYWHSVVTFDMLHWLLMSSRIDTPTRGRPRRSMANVTSAGEWLFCLVNSGDNMAATRAGCRHVVNGDGELLSHGKTVIEAQAVHDRMRRRHS